MAERKLAHIEIVHDITPIPNADNIVQIYCLGWALIAKKDEFKEGDKCVYIEIDSQVDTTKSCFEFLESKKGRIKTIKFNKFGVISQGIAMPLEAVGLNPDKYEVGDDVTKVLGIKKYENPEERRLAREARDLRIDRVNVRHKKFIKSKFGNWLMKHKFTRSIVLSFLGGKKAKPKAFPDFITKTDETRIENIPWEIENKSPLTTTEKLDGTSSSYFIKKKKGTKYEFGVCSRNVRQLDREQACYHEYNIYWAMADKYDIESNLLKIAKELNYPDVICVQGESIGNVQGNPYKLKEDDLYLFNFIVDGKRWSSVKGKEFTEKYGFKWVPILQTDFVCPDTMEEMKLLADGKSVINPNVIREGIVLRSDDNTRDFKDVSREYLIKHQ